MQSACLEERASQRSRAYYRWCDNLSRELNKQNCARAAPTDIARARTSKQAVGQGHKWLFFVLSVYDAHQRCGRNAQTQESVTPGTQNSKLKTHNTTGKHFNSSTVKHSPRKNQGFKVLRRRRNARQRNVTVSVFVFESTPRLRTTSLSVVLRHPPSSAVMQGGKHQSATLVQDDNNAAC